MWLLPALLSGAAILCALLIAALLPLLRRYALARPNARSSHSVPTPQGAGIAVIAATVCCCLAGIAVGSPYTPALPVVLGAAVAMALLGAIDDIRAIQVAPRLIVQALLVGIVIGAIPDGVRVFSALPLLAERALLLAAGLWFVNLTNFMDGIDWMTVAGFIPLTAGLVLCARYAGLPSDIPVLAIALCGAVLGFAAFNRPVASVFLGDVGSLPLGLLSGWLLVLLAGHGHLVAALLLPLYAIADATITLLQRVQKGERFWEAHRTHFYQRATARGFSVMQVVIRVFILNIVLAALALATIQWPTLTVSVAALIGGAVLVGGLLLTFARGRR